MVPEGEKPSNPVETTENYVLQSEHGRFERDESLENESDTLAREARRQAVIERAKQRLAEIESTGNHAYLRPHQLPGYINGLRLIAGYNPDADEPNSGHLIAPTGSGKSAVALAIANDTGARTLFVTSRHTLVDQMIAESVPDFTPSAQVQELSGRTRTERLKNPSQRSDTDFTNYHYLAIGDEEFTPKPGDYDLNILDEAHDSLGRVTSEKLKPLEAAALATIVTTATPATQVNSVIKRYPTRLDHQTMLDGIEGDYLSGIQIFAAHSGHSFDDKVHGASREYMAHGMEPLVQDQQRNGIIYDMALHGLKHTNGTGLIVCIRGNGQQHAQDVAAGLGKKTHPLQARNIYVEAIGDHRKDKDNFNAIQALKHGEIDYLTTTEMATQGVDFRALRVGIVATSVRSQLKLEQIMGRGMRLKDDPFLFYQLFDTPRNNPAGLALAWDVLDIKEPQQGMSVLRPGTSEDRLVPVSSLPSHLRPFPEQFALQEPRNIGGTDKPKLRLATDSVTALEGTPVSLTRLQEQTGIRRNILRRILFDNAYTAGLEENETGSFEEHYPEEAAILLDYLVSRKEHKTLPESARELGVTYAKLYGYISCHDIYAPALYARGEQKRAPMQHFLSIAQREHLREILSTPRALTPNEIGLQEIGNIAGNFNFRSRGFLEQRGFIPESVTLTTGKQAFVYDRETLTAYAQAYKDAAPLPNKTDFVSVRQVAREFAEAREYHIFAAASILGIPITFFKVNDRHRDEFLTTDDQERIEDLLPKVIAYYDKQHAERKAQDPSYNRHNTKERVSPPSPGDLAPKSEQDTSIERITIPELIDTMAVPAHTGDVHAAMQQLGITPDAQGLRIADAQRVYAAILKKTQPSEDLPKPTESKGQIDITQPLHAPTLRPKQRPGMRLPRYVQELSREPLDEPRNLTTLKTNQFANTLLAIAKFHPLFEGLAQAARTEHAIVVDRHTYAMLFTLMQQNLPRINETWIPAPQICQDHGIDVNSLNAWLSGGSYDTKHLIPVIGKNISQKLYFCSPELARHAVETLRSHAQRLPDDQSFDVDAAL
jgi:superfamily II DNA or RNA helicase